MAIIDCPECTHKISDQSITCPSCGFPTSKMKFLIKCPECSESISNQSISCNSCGFPITKPEPFEAVPPQLPNEGFTNNKASLPTKKTQVRKPKTKAKTSKFSDVFAIILIIFLIYQLATCSDNDTQELTQNVQVNYEHYSGGNFDTMQDCLDFVKEEAQSEGMRIEISSDKPNKVTGSFNGDSSMFFYCEKKETGTNGTFFEAAYPKFN